MGWAETLPGASAFLAYAQLPVQIKKFKEEKSLYYSL